ncbi:hypothetical protein [Winogradskyella sp. PE311]|uniref:hypothetical protein n=1 Tax=Winogradskyella sp. PE311 TaxID=3366943 RepID=UPI00398170E9
MKHRAVIKKSHLKQDFCNLLKLRNSVVILLSILVFNCSKTANISTDDINGYWEIEKVTLSNGTEKEYKYNETIDFIKINDSLIGFRKKLKPGINDTYFTSDDAEKLHIKRENDSVNMYYSTLYSEWKETVLEVSAEHLKVITKNKDVYLYKRYTPIKLDIE